MPDLRSFERQCIDLAPTIHLGPAVTQMEKRGIETNIGNLNRDIKRTNRALLAIRKLIAELQSWLAELLEKRNKLIEEMREPTLLWLSCVRALSRSTPCGPAPCRIALQGRWPGFRPG